MKTKQLTANTVDQITECVAKKLNSLGLKQLKGIEAHEVLPKKLMPYWLHDKFSLNAYTLGQIRKCECGTWFRRTPTKRYFCSYQCSSTYRKVRRITDAFEPSFKTPTSAQVRSFTEFIKGKETLKEKTLLRKMPDSIKVWYLGLAGETCKDRRLLATGAVRVPKCRNCGRDFEVRRGGTIVFCSRDCFYSDEQREKNKQRTCLKRYGVSNPAHLLETQQKRMATCTERYGMTRRAEYALKTVKFQKCEFSVQGYEDIALDYLIRIRGVAPEKIQVASTGSVPTVVYRYEKRECRYYPDMRIGNTLIEVKSFYTMLRTDTLYEKTCLKAKAALEQGYKFKLLLFTKQRRLVKVPENWFDLPRQTLVTLYQSS